MKNSKLHPASGIYLALVMLFLYLPIIMLIVLSFNGTNSTSVIQGFSTKWYVELFKDSATINALTNTLILAVTSAITATVIGTLAAVGIDKMKKVLAKLARFRYDNANSYETTFPENKTVNTI